MGEDNDIQATLTGAPNALASFQVTPRDESWYEAAAGVAVQGERVGFHLQYAKDFERDDLELSRFTAAFSLKF
jgi:hypothetical protein